MITRRPDRFKAECTNCGACCRLVGLAKPALDRGDLGCIFLDDDNKCMIYETRPYFCNVYETFKRKYSRHMTWEVFKKFNKLFCRIARRLVAKLDNDKEESDRV